MADIMNANFTQEEVENSIDFLKPNKSPGITAELIKICKEIISPEITTVLNYIIETRDFPTN